MIWNCKNKIKNIINLFRNKLGEPGSKHINEFIKKLTNTTQLFLYLKGLFLLNSYNFYILILFIIIRNSLGDNGSKKIFEGLKKINTKILHLYMEK